ncbi:MAG: FAD-dependent oxidoreductase [Sedimentitalea sp.]|nr:FAD-dependent oxidoreductase [Sedimentitalea sp.]
MAEPARIRPAAGVRFDLGVETLIVGAGAAGLVAALAAHEAGQEALVIEADAAPAGSTALSAGLIPAAGTALQRAAGIADDAALFAADIQAKAKGENDPALVDLLARGSARAIDWLAGRHGLPFSVVDDFDYPGHSRRRMHGLPSRSGRELVDRLRAACEEAGIDIVCNRRAETLFTEDDLIRGVALRAPDGAVETIGCARLILACNGFGGSPALVARHMPQIAGALWFGHDGNRGDALHWGEALGAGLAHLGAYQGHGNVAHPHGILITWAVITEGGVQVNLSGQRFWDESQGYSEAARAVLSQPEGQAWTIFDARIAAIARQFADFRAAEAQGAIRTAGTLAELAEVTGLPAEALRASLAARGAPDRFGRIFSKPPLAPPFCAVRVTGALFHTQGGLQVDDQARVLHADGRPFANLHAAGGAACGVSGSADAGYLSGNGLLAAVVLGRIAGAAGR